MARLGKRGGAPQATHPSNNAGGNNTANPPTNTANSGSKPKAALLIIPIL